MAFEMLAFHETPTSGDIWRGRPPTGGAAIKAATVILVFECCDDKKYLPLKIEGWNFYSQKFNIWTVDCKNFSRLSLVEDIFYRHNIQKVKLQWQLLLLPPLYSISWKNTAKTSEMLDWIIPEFSTPLE